MKFDTDSPQRVSSNILLSVIAPCYNEQENIAVLAARVTKVFDSLQRPAELILVDDGSNDATWRQIQLTSESDRRIVGVRHQQNRGIVSAWRSGLARSKSDLVCLIDADLQNRPEDIPRLLAEFSTGRSDLVQGVRRAQSGVTRLKVFSRGLNWMLNAVFRTKLRDNKSGFILCGPETLREILTHRWKYRYFQSFVGVSAASKNLRIAEVETSFDARNAGVSFLSRLPILVSLRIVWELCKFRVETWTFLKTHVNNDFVNVPESTNALTCSS